MGAVFIALPIQFLSIYEDEVVVTIIVSTVIAAVDRLSAAGIGLLVKGTVQTHFISHTIYIHIKKHTQIVGR